MERFWAVILIVLALAGRAAGADEEAARVIIVANSDDPDSVKLAHYYAERRGVPAENIIALKVSLAESVGWHEFVPTLFQPLQDELVKRGWIDGIEMSARDARGRKRYAMSGNKISYLVVCRGVPLKVVEEPDMQPVFPVAAMNPAFRTHTAAVDSELALLAQSGTPTLGFVGNPLFKNDEPSSIEAGQVVRVSRLDGPTVEEAEGLVDRAIAVEKTGLIGRSYVDIGGPHAQGDAWLRETEQQLRALGFDGDADEGGGTFPEWARFDAPALYFGWYAGTVNGPFVRPGFRFPPGAIALHIHSYSADTVQSPLRNWVGPLVDRGVTATFGNVTEPYLEFTHEPQLILKALARGDTLGAAAAYAVPVYSWQGIVIGDPLYRPFKVSFDEQWARLDRLAPEQRAYVVTRRMRLLEQAGRGNEAIWAGLAAQKKQPSLAVALVIAELERKAGDAAGARQALAVVTERRSFSAEEAPLAVIVAQQLVEGGEGAAAVELWKRVLGGRGLSKEMRVEWLGRALAVARAVHAEDQTERWQGELTELVPAAETEK